MQSTKPPGGTRDFLPDEIRRRTYVIDKVRAVYERYGFEPLETPAFENIETLLGKYGEEGNRLIFKILKRGEQESSGAADLALRYDLTVPLARVVAEYQSKLPPFFKRYQIQPVWRADRPQKGRFREFFQCDIDSVGSTSHMVEVEQLAAVSDVLTALGFTDFAIKLNHRKVLSGLLEAAGIPSPQHADALVALDKRDKIGDDGVLAEMAAKSIDTDAALRGLKLAANPSLDVHRAALQGLKDAGEHLLAMDQIETILRLSGNTHLRFDPSLARGLSYYTGAIMEISVPDLAGSLGGGGRYDNLVGMFLGRDIPACGFSLGLERIIVVMTERNMFPATLSSGAVDVVVAFMEDDSRSHAISFASELRNQNVRAEVYPELTKKFDKALKAASARGAKFMAVFGENERTLNQVSVRDLTKREALPPLERGGAAIAIARLLTS